MGVRNSSCAIGGGLHTSALMRALVIVFVATTEPVAFARQGAGDQKSLTGFWECIDPATGETIRKIQLNADGTYTQWEFPRQPGLMGVAVNSARYESSAESLTLYFALGRLGRTPAERAVREHGTIRWIDAGRFELKVDVGNMKGHTIEFCSLVNDAENEGSLAGVWNIEDSNSQVEFTRDGRFMRGAIDPAKGNQAVRYRYEYENPVLSVYRIDGFQEHEYLKANLKWSDSDHFTLSVFRLVEARFVPGKSERYRRAGKDPAIGIHANKSAGRPNPGGRIGEFKGLWECVVPATQRQFRVVEFKDDGTFEETINGLTTVKNELLPFLQYVTSNEMLAFKYVPERPINRLQREVVIDSGRVRWIDGDAFEYTLDQDRSFNDGMTKTIKRGTLLEFHRLGTPADAKRFSLIGDWKQSEPKDDVRFQSVSFRRDGSCTGSVGGRFEEKDGVLSFVVSRAGKQLRMARGTLIWIDRDTFSFTVLDGQTFDPKRIGSTYVLRRLLNGR